MQTNARKWLVLNWIGVPLLLTGSAQAWPWDGDLPSDPLAPLALVGSNINISHFADNETETAVAINPLNPRNIVVFSNYEVTDALFRAYSFDGGLTWTGGSILPGACCDANAAFDSYGNLFLTYLHAGVQLTYSTDGGVTFAPPVTVAVFPPGNLPGFNSKSLGSGGETILIRDRWEAPDGLPGPFHESGPQAESIDSELTEITYEKHDWVGWSNGGPSPIGSRVLIRAQTTAAPISQQMVSSSQNQGSPVCGRCGASGLAASFGYCGLCGNQLV